MVFGVSLNFSLTLYRFVSAKQGCSSHFSLLNGDTLFIKILQITIVVILSVFLPLIYLRNKTERFLERMIIRYGFFPKTFNLLISLEYWFCLNPILTFFLLNLGFYSLFVWKDCFTVSLIMGALIFRCVILVPFLVFRGVFDKNDIICSNLIFNHFSSYCVIFQEMLERRIILSPLFLLFVLFFDICFFFKILQYL